MLEGIEDLIRYHPETGDFSLLKRRKGKDAGENPAFLKKGYWAVRWKRKQIAAHRLAFYLMNGVMPSGMVDHINGDPSDNRWDNLREASMSLNSQNITKTKRSNGMTGTTFHKQMRRWQAQIRANGVSYYLGAFDTQEQAHAAYAKAKRRLHHPQCTRNLEDWA